MPRTRPEVNPKISVPKKKLGAKGVGSVGVSLARGMYVSRGGEVKRIDGIFSRGGGGTGIREDGRGG